MPTGTISYRIASETAGIDIDGVRYRATRSTKVPDVPPRETQSAATGPWTLWHDDQFGGSHSVGHCDAYDSVDEAVAAARRHDGSCDR